MTSSTLRLLRRPFDVVFKPSEIVDVPPTYDSDTLIRTLYIAIKLILFFVWNLLFYTVPLSLAGVGSSNRFIFRLIENSVFLLIAAALTFGAFHIGVLITGQSNGILRSLRVVTYSTALYLATLFTLVWYTAQSASIRVADEILLFIQAEFINSILDWMGSSLTLQGEYPTAVNTGAMTLQGKVILVSILIVGLYYLYVLYLGARLAHNTSKLTSILVIIFIIISPALYVVGSTIVVELAVTLPDIIRI